MTDEPPVDPHSEDELKDLDQRLKAIEARKRGKGNHSAEVGANQGYQALGELIGGILGGLGLGWLCDKWLGSTPICMIAGAILGMVAAVYLIVKQGQSRD